MDSDREGGIQWNEQLERILSNEGERSLCFSWLHNHAQKRYSKLDSYISIPVIILSTVTGFLSASTGNIIPQSSETSMALGGVSVTVAIMQTLASKFGWAKRSEAHKVAMQMYHKIYKFILIELALPRNERMQAKDMLKSIREQLEHLSEISPQVPDESIVAFNRKFEHSTPDITKPEITNGLDPIFVYDEFHPAPEKVSIPAVPPMANNQPKEADTRPKISINGIRADVDSSIKVMRDKSGVAHKVVSI